MDPTKANFKRMIEIMGWSQSEAARQLGVTHGAVSFWCNPNHPNTPSMQTMRFLSMMVASEKPGAITVAGTVNNEFYTAEERELIQLFRAVPEHDRKKAMNLIKTAFDLFPSNKPTYPYKPDPYILNESKRDLADALASIPDAERIVDAELRQRHATDAPSARKAPPSKAAFQRSKVQPGVPNPAPNAPAKK